MIVTYNSYLLHVLPLSAVSSPSMSSYWLHYHCNQYQQDKWSNLQEPLIVTLDPHHEIEVEHSQLLKLLEHFSHVPLLVQDLLQISTFIGIWLLLFISYKVLILECAGKSWLCDVGILPWHIELKFHSCTVWKESKQEWEFLDSELGWKESEKLHRKIVGVS